MTLKQDVSEANPNRRAFLKFLGLGLATPQLANSLLASPSPSVKRPNFLWICTDQQRWDTITALGNTHIKTPNLDGLVKNGTTFTVAHCSAPLCTPSRSGFMTGMYPSAIAACKNGAACWAEKAPLVTKLLKDAGYVCGLSGKLHLSSAYGDKVEKRPQDDGYSEFYFSTSPYQGGPANDYLTWLRKQGYEYEDFKKLSWQEQAPLHQTTWCCERAADFLTRHRNRPWLFNINIFHPHSPYHIRADFLKNHPNLDKISLPEFRESDIYEKSGWGFTPYRYPDSYFQSRQAEYYATIELVDQNIGGLIEALEATGQIDNTVIIFTSDHGENLGDHGLYGKGNFYEGSVRVPLIWSGPSIQKNIINDSLVELTEIAPTILDLAGEKVPQHMQGISLVPALRGKKQKLRDHIHSQFYAGTGPAPGSEDWPEEYLTMYRDKNYKHVVYHGYARGELFDLQNDPHEYKNLWDQPQYLEIRDELLLKNFNVAARANYPAMPVMSNQADARKKTKLKRIAIFENHPDPDLPGHWLSIYSDRLYHLEVRHGSGKVKLTDKHKNELWYSDNHDLKYNMLRKCFDAFVFSIDTGPERIGRY